MKYKLLFIVSLLNAFACEKVVDVTIKSTEEFLVIEGGITHRINQMNDLQIIKLSKTINFFDQNSNAAVENATVTVSDGTTVYRFSSIGDGEYAAQVQTVIGNIYTLNIEYNGQLYEATETLITVPPIDSIYTVFEEETLFTDAGYLVKINTTDPIGEVNYYNWKVYKNGELFIVPDPGNRVDLIASDQFFNGQPLIGITPNEEAILEVGDQAKVEQHGVTERFHNYLYEFYTQTGGNVFLGDPPPGRIKGNVINLSNPDQIALGYFAVTSVAEAEITQE